MNTLGFPGGTSGKEPACQCRRFKRHGLSPWVGKIPWSEKWLPALVSLLGQFHGQRSLAGYSSWGCKELDMTEWGHTHTHTPTYTLTHGYLKSGVCSICLFPITHHPHSAFYCGCHVVVIYKWKNVSSIQCSSSITFKCLKEWSPDQNYK